jgi:hypothetical protein
MGRYLPTEVATALGIGPACPSESAIRRLVQRLDADRFGQCFVCGDRARPLG